MTSPTYADLHAAIAKVKAAAAVEIIWAQHDGTGRWWHGMRRDLPPGYDEILFIGRVESLPPRE